MKNKGYIFFGIIVGVFLTLAVFWKMPSSQAYARPDLASLSSTVTPGAPVTDEGGNTAPLQANISSDEQIPPDFPAGSLAQPLALPTQVPGETTVYFVPTDNDATATVLYLYNTDTVSHVVALRGFSYNGVLVYPGILIEYQYRSDLILEIGKRRRCIKSAAQLDNPGADYRQFYRLHLFRQLIAAERGES